MLDGDRESALVPDVLDAEVRASLLERLDALPKYAIAAADSPLGPVRQWGAMLGPSPDHPRGPDPAEHAARNAELWDALGELGVGIRDRVLAALRSLSEDLDVVEGGHIASIRCMPSGCGAPLHRDRYPPSEAYAALRQIADLDRQMVWYLMLQTSPEGGALRVMPTMTASNDPIPPESDIRSYRVPEGALLIHPGSRWWHEVSPPVGGDRITLGGVCAPKLDGSGWVVSA